LAIHDHSKSNFKGETLTMSKPSFYRISSLAFLMIMIFTACAQKQEIPKAELPAGKAYAEGKEIYFTHTETSDASVAKLLTDMMKSPVLEVPALAQVPDSVLANVYVFDNGLSGMGPLGFQSDVFDNPPGTSGYSPLRRLNVVTWTDPAMASELKSAADVLAAENAGNITIKRPGVVINMPFVVWDGGKR
jgi:hypothetical protein